MWSSFLIGDQHLLVQARLIDRLADSAQGIEWLLPTPALVEEVANRLFDQFVATPIVAASEFLLDLLCQVRGSVTSMTSPTCILRFKAVHAYLSPVNLRTSCSF